MEELPDDALAELFSFLFGTSLQHACSVLQRLALNQRWYEVASQVARDLVVAFEVESSCRPYHVRAEVAPFGRVHTLTVDLKCVGEHFDAAVVRRNFPNVQTLNLRGPALLDHTRELLRDKPELRVLRLVTEREDAGAELPALPRITEELVAPGLSFTDAAVPEAELFVMNLSGWLVTDTGLAKTAGSRLRILKLSRCTGLTDEGLGQLLSSCAELQCLDLSFTAAGSAAVGAVCGIPSLESLYLNLTTGPLSETEYVLLSQSLPSLRRLGIGGHTAVTDSALDALGVHGKLEWLDVSVCVHLTAKAVAALKQRCPLKRIKSQHTLKYWTTVIIFVSTHRRARDSTP